MTRSEMIDEAVRRVLPRERAARWLDSFLMDPELGRSTRARVFYATVREHFRAIEREQNQRRKAS